MSKVRQAIDYERQLAAAQVQAHRELTDAQVRGTEALLAQATSYERRLTDGQFGPLKKV